MAKTTRSTFKAYCPESFHRLEEMAKNADQRRCTITLAKKHVSVKVEDPHNTNGFLKFNFDYAPDVEDKLRKKLDEIDSILRTFYQPLYLAFIPIVKTQLKNVSLEYDDSGAYLEFADGRPTESFGYNPDEYECFVTRISDLLLPVSQSKNHCKSGEHCQNCHDAHCSHNSNYTQTLWEEMDPTMQQNFLSKLSPEEQAKFLQTVKQEEE